MKTASHIARILLGLIFTVFGLNGFLHFIPLPLPSDVAGQFMGAVRFPLLCGGVRRSSGHRAPERGLFPGEGCVYRIIFARGGIVRHDRSEGALTSALSQTKEKNSV